MLALFDLPDPGQETGRRAVTTVPTQALALLNAPFVRQCATAAANRFVDEEDPQKRVSNIYLVLYGRPPSTKENEEALQLVNTLRESKDYGEQSETYAWSRLCQALLISNEFLFRD